MGFHPPDQPSKLHHMEAVEQDVKRRKPKPFDHDAEIVSTRHLRLVVGLAPVTIWRLRREGKFPQALRLSKGRIGWRRADLERWLAECERTKR
jgi:prophage regulatory protein